MIDGIDGGTLEAEEVKVGGAINVLIREKDLSMDAVTELYEEMLVPTLLYGNELFMCYEYDKYRVIVVEMNYLRRIKKLDWVRNEIV